MARVSVVVPTYRRPDLLGALPGRAGRPGVSTPAAYEILVADDAGSDGDGRRRSSELPPAPARRSATSR